MLYYGSCEASDAAACLQPRCSGCRRWAAASVLTLTAIKRSFGKGASSSLNGGSE
jgi:hypothetical protein